MVDQRMLDAMYATAASLTERDLKLASSAKAASKNRAATGYGNSVRLGKPPDPSVQRRNQGIAAQLRAGKPVKDVAAMYGVKPNVVYKVRRDLCL